MTNRYDNERAFYMKELSVTSGNIKDLERNFLLTKLSLTSGNTEDLTMLYFVSEGITDINIDDAWKSFLNGEGYTGNVEDMKLRYFTDNL